MENLVLQTKARAEIGSAECRRLRRKGIIPGNVYGHGQSHTISFNSHEFDMLRQKMHSEHAVMFVKGNSKVFIEPYENVFKIHSKHLLLFNTPRTMEFMIRIQRRGYVQEEDLWHHSLNR